jgi:hypothetical protein
MEVCLRDRHPDFNGYRSRIREQGKYFHNRTSRKRRFVATLTAISPVLTIVVLNDFQTQVTPASEKRNLHGVPPFFSTTGRISLSIKVWKTRQLLAGYFLTG